MNVKEIRKKLILTQTEFAKKLGMSLSAVQAWESGSRNPSAKATRKILLLARENGIIVC